MKFACLDVLRNVLLQVFLYTCRQEVCFGITHNEWLIGGGCESELRVITHFWGFWGRVLKEFLPSSSNRLHAYPNSLPQSCWAPHPLYKLVNFIWLLWLPLFNEISSVPLVRNGVVTGLGSFIQCELRKTKPGFDSNFLKIKKDTTKLISVHDSIIILLQFGTLFIHIRPWMAAQQSCLWTCQN